MLGLFYASTRYEIRDTRYEIRDIWFRLLKIVLQGLNKIRKKCRGIAGGTIPRVPMTPSLAAGVIWQATSPLELN